MENKTELKETIKDVIIGMENHKTNQTNHILLCILDRLDKIEEMLKNEK